MGLFSEGPEFIGEMIAEYKSPLIILAIIFLLVIIIRWYQSISKKMEGLR